MNRLLLISLSLLCFLGARSADPTATDYTVGQCAGTYMPYPAVKPVACPDSLEPVMINHVGRHGARFMSSDKSVGRVLAAITGAERAKTLTETGRRLRDLCNRIVAVTAGRWGALDSLGMMEQTLIATRMQQTWTPLFANGRVKAISSYSPRCIMSMYCFAHQLSRLDNRLEITTSSGRQHSPLMRFFDSNEDYRAYREEGKWKTTLDEFAAASFNPAPLERILGKATADTMQRENAQALLMSIRDVVAAAAATGIATDPLKFFTRAEYNRLWAQSNLRHYLQYSASTLSAEPAEMAAPLLRALIDTTDDMAEGRADTPVLLRFGHAETLMPLLAMMHLPGCYYMTNYFDTVGLHWRDFDIVPMAANLQLILLRNKENGKLYLRVDLNERPVTLIPGRTALYTPWPVAREYLIRCLPLIYQ